MYVLVLFDCSVLIVLQLTVFLGSMGIMEGRSKDEIKAKYRDLFWPAIQANWKVWPAIQVSLRYVGLWRCGTDLSSVRELQVHSAGVPRAIPIHLRMFLDPVSLTFELIVRSMLN